MKNPVAGLEQEYPVASLEQLAPQMQEEINSKSSGDRDQYTEEDTTHYEPGLPEEAVDGRGEPKLYVDVNVSNHG